MWSVYWMFHNQENIEFQTGLNVAAEVKARTVQLLTFVLCRPRNLITWPYIWPSAVFYSGQEVTSCREFSSEECQNLWASFQSLKLSSIVVSICQTLGNRDGHCPWGAYSRGASGGEPSRCNVEHCLCRLCALPWGPEEACWEREFLIITSYMITTKGSHRHGFLGCSLPANYTTLLIRSLILSACTGGGEVSSVFIL